MRLPKLPRLPEPRLPEALPSFGAAVAVPAERTSAIAAAPSPATEPARLLATFERRRALHTSQYRTRFGTLGEGADKPTFGSDQSGRGPRTAASISTRRARYRIAVSEFSNRSAGNDFDRALDDAWVSFRSRLADRIATASVDDQLVLETSSETDDADGRLPFVQCSRVRPPR